MAVIDTSLRTESRDRYLTYALSVVSGRALPDVRDGLKPVQRRILYAMYHSLNLKPGGSHKKSAAVVGEVLARFHPHGDSACYDAMVRMAQPFSLRYPLVNGQGNFGSLDGDSAAAYRYTEAKLEEIALEVIGEIDQETVAFKDNFDSTTQEPTVLPSKIPNLLINGATGIAVGMATSIPPHNLIDVVKALVEYSKDSEITQARLASLVKGPDFPTGCSILNSRKSLSEIYKTGRGVIRMRGDWKLEEGTRGRQQIIVTTIPYGSQNKSQLVERIANLIIDKKVPQLCDVRDESTEEIRVVLELVQDADPELAMAYIYKHTPLESNFPVNLTALVPAENGSLRPQLLSLKEMLQYFLDFREEVTERRLQFELKNLLDRIHILDGFVIIFDGLDEAIRIVRKSTGRADAANKLMKAFSLSERQSYAVVDMRIYQLSKTNIDDIRAELKEKQKRVSEIEKILNNRVAILEIVRTDLQELADKYGDRRRSSIIKDHVDEELNETDFIVHEDVYAIVTSDGWIKRIRQSNDLSTTRLREGDRILHGHPLSTKDSVAFLTNLGYLYVVSVHDFPSSSGYGDPIQKHLKFRDGEHLIETLAVLSEELEPLEGYAYELAEGSILTLVSAKGLGFGLEIQGLDSIKRNGKRIMKLRKGDTLAAVCPLDTNVVLVTRQGSGLRIKKKDIPVRNGAAVGVALIGVRDGDAVAGVASYGRKGVATLYLGNGKEKKLDLGEVTTGRRGLKGTKVIARGEIDSLAR